MHTTIIATNFMLRFDAELKNSYISCEWDLSGRETFQLSNGDVVRSPLFFNEDSPSIRKVITFYDRNDIEPCIKFYESNEFVDAQLLIEISVPSEFLLQLKEVMQLNLVGTFDVEFDPNDFDYGIDRNGRDLIMKNHAGKVLSISAQFSQKYDYFTLKDNFHLRPENLDNKKYDEVKKFIYKEIGKYNIYMALGFFALAYAYFKHI